MESLRAYAAAWTLEDGTPVTIRPIRPDDEQLMAKFHRALSEESVRNRYFGQIPLRERIRHERLLRVCTIDYDMEIALVVDRTREDGSHELLGVGRLSKLHKGHAAEFAIVLRDSCQGHGLGGKLLTLLVKIGRMRGFDRIVAHILPDNFAMQRVARHVGFHVQYDPDGGECRAELDCGRPVGSRSRRRCRHSLN